MPGSGFCHQVFANHTKHIRMAPLLSICNERGKNSAQLILTVALLRHRLHLQIVPSENRHRSTDGQVDFSLCLLVWASDVIALVFQTPTAVQ